MVLEDYKEIVGTAAGFVTFCQMFSGVFLCKDIYKNGSTNNTPAMPFLGGFVLSILFYQHGLLLNDSAMSKVNLGGLVLNIFYLTFYYLWTNSNKKPDFLKEFFKAIALIFILLIYIKTEDPEKVEFRFGIINTVLLLLLISSPLFSLGEVFKNKSTESLPFPMIFSGFVVSAHWLLYGIIIKNNFVIFQNAVASIICLIQLVPFVIFSKNTKISKKSR